MTKKNPEVKPIVITSHDTDAKVNLKAKAEKMRKMGASPLIMRMYGE